MYAPRTEALVKKRGEIRDHALYELARELEDQNETLKQFLVAAGIETARLDKLEKYLSDVRNNIAGPEKDSPGWQLGHCERLFYVVDSDGGTLRDVIDNLK